MVIYYSYVIFSLLQLCSLIIMKTTIMNVFIAAGTLLILWLDSVPDYLAIPFLSLALIFKLFQITTKMKS